jgi:hypothetical protein
MSCTAFWAISSQTHLPGLPRADVMILEIFSSKNWLKTWRLLLKLLPVQNLTMTLVFEKNANSFAENLQKISENHYHNIV